MTASALVLAEYAMPRPGAHKEHAMTTVIKLLRIKFGRRQLTQIDDHLLCDIGLSRILFEYQES
jgi:uncharacterized protein YjiS (DUF1127 family)